MSFEVFVVLLLAAALLLAIIRKLFLIAFIVLVVAIAFYTGLAGAFIDIVMSFLPAASESSEVAQAVVLPMFFT